MTMILHILKSYAHSILQDSEESFADYRDVRLHTEPTQLTQAPHCPVSGNTVWGNPSRPGKRKYYSSLLLAYLYYGRKF